MYLSLTYRFFFLYIFYLLECAHILCKKKNKKKHCCSIFLIFKVTFFAMVSFGRVAVFTVGTSIRKFITEAGFKSKSRTGFMCSPPLRCLSLCTAKLQTLGVLGLQAMWRIKRMSRRRITSKREKKCWCRITGVLTFHLFLHICTKKSLFSQNDIFKNAQLHNI